jgi:hypothetical protein
MRQILELTGVRREAIVTKGRNPAIGYECFLYERGPIRYIGLLRDLPPQPVGGRLSWHGHQFRHATTEKETVAVGLPAEREVYEVRTGKHLGRTAFVSLEMGPAEAKVLGLLPYRVTEIAIGELKPRYRPGEEVKYKAAVAVSKGKAGDHVLRLEVFDPDGRLVPCYTKNVLAASGRYDDSVPLVLNEKAGPWTIKVTDVTTKVSKSAAFEVNVTDH